MLREKSTTNFQKVLELKKAYALKEKCSSVALGYVWELVSAVTYGDMRYMYEKMCQTMMSETHDDLRGLELVMRLACHGS